MKKIMVVDDAEVQRFQLAFNLQRAKYSVIEATNGQDGLDKLAANPDVALIICDVHMPLMDGLTMCTEIFNSPSLSHPPVFMLTTEPSTQLKDSAKAVGVKAWILKPFTAEKLLTAIQSVIGS